MKRSLTAVIALATAAGFTGMAYAQSETANTTAPPAASAPANVQATAPAAQAQANPAMAPRATPAPQASTQLPAGTSDFWSRNISQDEVRQAQQQLKAQGLYNGPIDGMAGPEMQRALARYQQQNGLRRTATLDEQTMGRLGGGMSPAAGVTAPPAAASPMAGATTTPPAGASPAARTTTPPAGTTAATAGTTAPPAGTAAPTGAGDTTPSAPAAPITQPVTR